MLFLSAVKKPVQIQQSVRFQCGDRKHSICLFHDWLDVWKLQTQFLLLKVFRYFMWQIKHFLKKVRAAYKNVHSSVIPMTFSNVGEVGQVSRQAILNSFITKSLFKKFISLVLSGKKSDVPKFLRPLDFTPNPEF